MEKMDDNVLLAIQKAEIKGLNEEIERLKVEYKLTALTKQDEKEVKNEPEKRIN